MSLYERLCDVRERALIVDSSSKSREEKMKILSQLMNLAFNNTQNPDELPKVFTIRNLECIDSEMLAWFLMHCVNVKVRSVTLVYSDWVRGKTFEIELF